MDRLALNNDLRRGAGRKCDPLGRSDTTFRNHADFRIRLQIALACSCRVSCDRAHCGPQQAARLQTRCTRCRSRHNQLSLGSGWIFDGLGKPQRLVHVPAVVWPTAFSFLQPIFRNANAAMGDRKVKDRIFDAATAIADFGWSRRVAKIDLNTTDGRHHCQCGHEAAWVADGSI